LSRERALLGDDANQFTSPNDTMAARVEDDDDDLLGGGGDFQGGDFHANVNGEELSGFESSFPVIDTTNEVSLVQAHTRNISPAAFRPHYGLQELLLQHAGVSD
jgi:hypothetical protein